MDYLIICGVAVLISTVTLFSGFGLGTVLMPAFALFFPVPVAIAATAVVHLANNVFKVILVGKGADWGVVKRFALPGAVAALAGAWVLGLLDRSAPLFMYHFGGRIHSVTAVKLIIGVLIIFFACFELVPRLGNVSFDRKYLFFGGLLSGFFGGLSGNQGALRSAFLIKAGLSGESYVGTGSVSAVIVDVSRLLAYGAAAYSGLMSAAGSIRGLVGAAIVAAFLGSFVGSRLIRKITVRSMQIMVGILLITAGTGMLTGFF